MRYSVKSLMRLAEKVLPPSRVPVLAFSYKSSRKLNGCTANELFSSCAQNGFSQYGDCYYLEGAPQSKLADILCQLIGEAGKVDILPKNKQIYI